MSVRKRDSGLESIATRAFVSTVGTGAAAKTVVTLTFSGNFVESNGSLTNGNYDLIIDANQISQRGDPSSS
ncbi:MAG: hypothetical protein SGI77_03455 [Pirellulaceae bacterium]|nr:hypothetical protein [Pirellulaceae bacterium]